MRDLFYMLFGMCIPLIWLCISYVMKKVMVAMQKLEKKDDVG